MRRFCATHLAKVQTLAKLIGITDIIGIIKTLIKEQVTESIFKFFVKISLYFFPDYKIIPIFADAK
ncbi:hypothetical protein HMPREF9078_01737 [Capnocytophaga sp. oral taxon 380 str. F0488]|nr:hypothetical protein HMPREF9078_01737 [Capnocytophaga sp. oral taxon 380 str. F0488]